MYGIFFVTLVAALTMPWWVAVPLMVFVLGYEYGPPVTVFAAVMMDALYGSHIVALYDFTFLYTAIFLFVAIIAIFLRERVVE